jgi:hypothetical protein
MNSVNLVVIVDLLSILHGRQAGFAECAWLYSDVERGERGSTGSRSRALEPVLHAMKRSTRRAVAQRSAEAKDRAEVRWIEHR